MFSAATPLTIFKLASFSDTLPCKIVRVPVGEKISYASKNERACAFNYLATMDHYCERYNPVLFLVAVFC